MFDNVKGPRIIPGNSVDALKRGTRQDEIGRINAGVQDAADAQALKGANNNLVKPLRERGGWKEVLLDISTMWTGGAPGGNSFVPNTPKVIEGPLWGLYVDPVGTEPGVRLNVDFSGGSGGQNQGKRLMTRGSLFRGFTDKIAVGLNPGGINGGLSFGTINSWDFYRARTGHANNVTSGFISLMLMQQQDAELSELPLSEKAHLRRGTMAQTINSTANVPSGYTDDWSGLTFNATGLSLEGMRGFRCGVKLSGSAGSNNITGGTLVVWRFDYFTMVWRECFSYTPTTGITGWGSPDEFITCPGGRIFVEARSITNAGNDATPTVFLEVYE